MTRQEEAACWVLYTQHANAALRAMQEEAQSIREYEKMPKANPIAAKIRRERLRTVYQALMGADRLLKEIDKRNKAHFAEGYKKGLEESSRAEKKAMREDREGFRAYTIQRAMETQPNLY